MHRTRTKKAALAASVVTAGLLAGTPMAHAAAPVAHGQSQSSVIQASAKHRGHWPKQDRVKSAQLITGQYQSAYSARNHLLWVTSAVGRPPVTDSKLTAVDPATLKVKKTITPPVVDESTGAVEAVYGVAVDDRHNTVWVTNTRDNSVAVYSQRSGKHLATLPNVKHAREVVVDTRRNLAWATANGGNAVVEYDTSTLTEKKRFTVAGSSPAGLALDPTSGDVYATDLANAQLIKLSPHSNNVTLIPAGDSPISVALSRNAKTAYVASQTTGVSIIDLHKGVTQKVIDKDNGALSVATDPRTGKVIAANRTAGNAVVINPRVPKVIDTITTGANANHVSFGGGYAWILDKSGSGAADKLFRVSMRHR